MGNTIKNYERKKRRERKEAQREINKIVHDLMVERMGLSNALREKEQEVFDFVNNSNWFSEDMIWEENQI